MPDPSVFRRVRFGLIVLAAAGAWLLVSRWWAGTPVEPRQLDAMNRQATLNTETMQDMLANEVTERTTSEQRDRLESPLGLAMFRKCIEWTEFRENHPSELALGNEQRACAEYRRYIETGELPD